MATQALPKTEVKKRLIRLRNLERLHEAQRFTIWRLRDENRELKKEIVALRATVRAQQQTIDDLKLQLEELRAMVFGKKREHRDGDRGDIPPAAPTPPAHRTDESYQRNIPQEGDITETRLHPMRRCTSCGVKLRRRKTASYIEEDIPLPQKKIVIRHVIEQGYCGRCAAWRMGAHAPSAPVILGAHVKRYVVYLAIVCRASYAHIQDVLRQTYDFALSQGEIANIMRNEGERLRPAYERLKTRIRGEPSIHLDETTWNLLVGGDHGYAWTMTGGSSADAVFVLGKTRGGGNARILIGDSTSPIVTDDYAAYRNLDNPHQLCCAHILRKLRDLAMSNEISDETRVHCRTAYDCFAVIYADIETARTSAHPMAAYDALHARIAAFAIPYTTDPAKLLRVKAQVGARSERYLTCLVYPGVASDNNAAERSLRHLVLKRKISFGSISERTAETTAILLSVLMSWKRHGELRNYLMGA